MNCLVIDVLFFKEKKLKFTKLDVGWVISTVSAAKFQNTL